MLDSLRFLNQIFNEIEDDQYDFHGYNLRKFTINTYLRYNPFSLGLLKVLTKVRLLKWEDRLRSQPTYIYVAIAASRVRLWSSSERPLIHAHIPQIYVAVHDEPALVTAASASGILMSLPLVPG